MNLTIEIPASLEVVLNAKAHAQGVTTSSYVRQVLEQVLSERLERTHQSKKSAFGLLAKYGPGPSAEEIDANRREMLRGFAEDVP